MLNRKKINFYFILLIIFITSKAYAIDGLEINNTEINKDSAQSIYLENKGIPTLNEIKAEHIKQNHGQFALDNLSSISASGKKIEYLENKEEEYHFRVLKKKPNLVRVYRDKLINGVRYDLEIIFDGKNAVQVIKNKGTEISRANITGENLKDIKREAGFDGPFLISMKAKEFITISGYDKVGDDECILLLINDKANLPYKKIWISLDNFQERKVEKHFINEGNLEIHDFYYEKYIKTPSNVLYASVVKHHIDKNISSKTTIYSLESNYGLYNNIFEID